MKPLLLFALLALVCAGGAFAQTPPGAYTSPSTGSGSVSGQANNVIPKGTTATSITQQSSCTDNGTTFSCTEPVASSGAVTAGTGCTPAASTATGGVCMTDAASTGWTPTAGFSYMRADSGTNKLVCSNNGAAEVACVGGSPTFPINIQTANYQVLAADFSSCKLIIANSTSSLTVTLVASGSQPAAGQCIQIENENTGTTTVAPSGQNVDGASTNITLGKGQGIFVVSDGTNYFTNRGIAGVGCTASCNWYPYWAGPISASQNQGVSANNQPLLLKFSTTVTNTVTKISFNVSTLSAASTGDVGFYGNCTTTCTLLAHTGSQSTAATGVQTITITPVILPPGNYYLGYCDSSTTVQISSGLVGGSAATTQLQNPIANTAGFDATDTCTAGVLPNTFTITNVTNSTGVNGWPVVTVSN